MIVIPLFLAGSSSYRYDAAWCYNCILDLHDNLHNAVEVRARQQETIHVLDRVHLEILQKLHIICFQPVTHFVKTDATKSLLVLWYAEDIM